MIPLTATPDAHEAIQEDLSLYLPHAVDAIADRLDWAADAGLIVPADVRAALERLATWANQITGQPIGATITAAQPCSLSRLYQPETARAAVATALRITRTHPATPDAEQALLPRLPDLVPMHHSTRRHVARQYDGELAALMRRAARVAARLARQQRAGQPASHTEWIRVASDLREGGAAVLVWRQRHPGRWLPEAVPTVGEAGERW